MTTPYETVTFRLSKDEKSLLIKKAQRLGLCVSAYLRAHAYITMNQDPIEKAISNTHQIDLEDAADASKKV